MRLEQAAQIVVDHGLSPVLACQLDIARGDALRQAGDPAATDLLFDAADRAEQLEAGNLLAGAALALCRLGPTSATGTADQRAAAVADRALTAVTDPALRAELAGEASLLHSMAGEPERCSALYEQAERQARALGDPHVLSRVLPHAYLSLGGPAFLDRRRAIAGEVAELAKLIEDPTTAWEASLLAYSVHLESAAPAVFAAVAQAREISDVVREPMRVWETLWMEAAVAHLQGELDEAESLITSTLASAGAVAPSRVVATYGAQLLALRIDQDRVGELVADLQMLVVAQPGLPAWRAALSLAAAHAERPELAAEQLAWFWATGSLRLPADFTWTAVAIVLARAATTIGSATMQTDLITALTPYKERLAWCGSCSYGPIDTALGMLLDALGNQQESRDAYTRARRVADRLGAKLYRREADSGLRSLAAAR